MRPGCLQEESTMLVLSRKQGEKLRIGDAVVITVVSTKEGRVRLGIEAPPDVSILRDELRDAERQEAAGRARAPGA
jgi:carbon storage regulator